MSVLDIILCICMALSVVQGVIRGFTEQVVALVAIILGTWVAFRFSKLICSLLLPYLHISEQVLYVLVFILMIILVIIVIHLLGKIIKASIRFIMLGWLDRLLGAVFSLFKAVLIIGILIILFNTLNVTFRIVPEEYLSDSAVYPVLKRIAYGVFPYFKELLFKQ